MKSTFTGVKNVSLSVLLLVATGVTSSPLWAQQAPEKTQNAQTKRDIRWGKTEDSGLRMGAVQLHGEPTLFCVIENAGENPVSFNDYFLGYSEAISVQARPKGTDKWIEILRSSGTQLYKSAGPSQENSVALAPHHIYLPPQKEERFVDLETTNTALNLGMSKEDVARINFLERESKRSSFLVETKYEWPEEWSGVIEWKVRQKLPNFGIPNQWQGELESGILEADAAEIRALAKRANYQIIFMRRQIGQADRNEQTPTEKEPQK